VTTVDELVNGTFVPLRTNNNNMQMQVKSGVEQVKFDSLLSISQ